MTHYRANDAYGEWHVDPGGIIRPWIAAGPLFHDVSETVGGRSLFEDLNSRSGEALFRQYVEAGELLLAAAHSEGDSLTFMGQSEKYRLIETEDPFVNWGHYFVGNRVVSNFLCTRLRVASFTTATFQLHTRIDPQVAIAVNGRIQFRSYADDFIRTDRSWDGEHTFSFALTLERGTNVITLAAFRMGRIACGALSLETVDESVRVLPPIRTDPPGTDRATIEKARSLYYPAREWYYPREHIRLLRLPGSDYPDGTVMCELISGGQTVRSLTVPMDQSEIDLGDGTEIGSDAFELRTTVSFAERSFEPMVFECALVDRTPAAQRLPYEDRQTMALEHFAREDTPWGQVARYALGRAAEIDPAVIEDGCLYIDRRLDCADFVLHPFLRLIHMDRGRHEIPADLVQRMTSSALGFRYWTDEPGSDSLVTGTENHQILFHTAEIIAGHLWPDEVFPNSGMRGSEHIEHGRILAEAWLLARLRTGFQEWHSSSYYPHWIAALVDLLDSIPEQESVLLKRANAVLTMGFLNIAADSYEGALLTSHGRVYAPMLKVPDKDGCSGLHWLLYGNGHLTESTGVVSLAAGGVRVPELLGSISDASMGETLTRHHSGDAQFIVHRTPDFMMSALQDYRAGERAAQVHPFQLTFTDRVVLFFSCPQTSNEGGGHRPDYWSGNGALPRVFGKKNVAVLLFRTGKGGWMSHCYFERDRFDETLTRNGWLFARKADGYVAIWSENGHETAVRGPYAGRELICRARSNTWIVETGRKENWVTFDRFVSAVAQTSPRLRDEMLEYRSPGEGEIRMGWEGPILVDGSVVDLEYPLVDGPHAHSEYGTGAITICFEDERIELGGQ